MLSKRTASELYIFRMKKSSSKIDLEEKFLVQVSKDSKK